MRFGRLSLRHEGVFGIGRQVISLFRQCITFCKIKVLSLFFICVAFPTLCYRLRNLFICRREQSVCHVVSTWREDWVPLAEILCGGIPVSVITLMTLIFIPNIGCCFMAHFDLVLRLGGSFGLRS